jgi:long-chain acyl-CoA synthetase
MMKELSLAKTLVDIFEASAEKFADKTVFIMRPKYRTIRWSYADFYHFVITITNLLQKYGLKKGERALLLAPNSPWWHGAFWGCQLAGVTVVPLMVQSNQEFIAKVWKQTNAKLLLKISSIKKPLGISCKVIDVDLIDEIIPLAPFQKHPPTKKKGKMIPAALTENDIVEILYTLGTTGEPKGVPLSHKNIVSSIQAILHRVPVKNSDTCITLLPLSHIFAQIVEFSVLATGGTILYAPSFNSRAIEEVMKEYQVTIFATAPEFLRILLKRTRRRLMNGIGGVFFRFLFLVAKDLPLNIRQIIFWFLYRKFGGRLRLILSSGAALDTELAKSWQALGCKVVQCYGLAETSSALTITPVDSPNIQSVGEVVPGVQLKIASDGEILARGPNVFSGYWKNRMLTKNAFENGWLKTGDIGYFDKNGFLYFVGRKKFMIQIESGKNVYPETIERKLKSIKGVEDACAFPFQKEGRTEIHVVLLGKIADPEKIIAKANRHLESFQQIHGWSIWPFPDFPRNAIGEVRRAEVVSYLIKKVVPERAQPHTVIHSALISILSDISGVPVSGIHQDTKLVSDLQLDSLGRIELVAQIEETVGVEIDEAAIGYETTVRDLEELVFFSRERKVKYRLRGWPRNFLARAIRSFFQRFILFPLLDFFTKLEVRGKDNLRDVSLPCIFVSNHLSDLDAPVIARVLPESIRNSLAMAAATDILYEKYWFLQPLAALFFNTYPFPRKGQVKSGLIYTDKLLNRGWSILIFPEGRISTTGKLLPLKPGVGVLATEKKIPVVPIKIIGTNEILPLHWRLPYPRKFRGIIEVRFGKPLYFGKKTSYREATKIIEQALMKL